MKRESRGKCVYHNGYFKAYRYEYKTKFKWTKCNRCGQEFRREDGIYLYLVREYGLPMPSKFLYFCNDCRDKISVNSIMKDFINMYELDC